MRTLCAILLLGVVPYVLASHHCDSYAINVAEAKTQRTGDDANNERLALKVFLQVKKGVFYTTHATPNNLPNSNTVCTAPTHGSECGGVEYYRTLKEGFDTFNEATLLKGIQFDTTFIGYNRRDHTAIEYKITIGGNDKDDYIFKWVEDTPITAHKLEDFNDLSKKTAVQIPEDVLNVLKSEFALYSYKPGIYNLYVTCDGKGAWVSYNQVVVAGQQVNDDLNSAITKLIAHANKKDNVKLYINEIDHTFPRNLSKYIRKQAV